MFCESHTLRFVKIGHREGAFRSRRSNIRFFSNVGTSRFAQFAKCCCNPVLIHVCKLSAWDGGCPIMTMHAGKEISALVTPNECLWALQHCNHRSSTVRIAVWVSYGGVYIIFSRGKRLSWGTRGQCPYNQGMTGHCLATLIEATHHHHRIRRLLITVDRLE